MSENTPKLRIGVVQFAPEIGEVQRNIEKARLLCARFQPRSLDLFCLPEMILTGYNFSGAASISPFLEKPYSGPTSMFCSQLEQQLHCYVTAGYPEELETQEVGKRKDGNGNNVDIVGANSAVLYGPDGQPIGNYRKTNLFETDQTWAKEGSGFVSYKLPAPLNTLSTAICMDLNPFPPNDWRLEDGPYEVAEYCTTNRVNVLVMLNAWLDPDDGDEEDNEEPSWSTVNYWAARLRPFWTESTSVNPELMQGKTFAGSSAIFDFHRGRGRPTLHDASMGRAEEGVRTWTV